MCTETTYQLVKGSHGQYDAGTVSVTSVSGPGNQVTLQITVDLDNGYTFPWSSSGLKIYAGFSQPRSECGHCRTALSLARPRLTRCWKVRCMHAVVTVAMLCCLLVTLHARCAVCL